MDKNLNIKIIHYIIINRKYNKNHDFDFYDNTLS